MKIWIITAFDPIPEDGDQLGRYLSLARLASSLGHEVHIYTSQFRHATKDQRKAESSREIFFNGSIHFHKIPASAYRSNKSPLRFWNHFQLGFNLKNILHRESKKHGMPDVLVAACPPNHLAFKAVSFAADHGIPSVLDIQDLWPEAFPTGKNFITSSWRNKAINTANQVVITCPEYRSVLPDNLQPVIIPIGLLRRPDLTEPPDRNLNLIYTGSIEPNEELFQAFEQLSKTSFHTWLFLKGNEKAAYAKRISALSNNFFRVRWNRPQQEVMNAIDHADIGLCLIQEDTPVYFPNKAFEYLASGLFLITNTPEGKLTQWLRDNNAGRAIPSLEALIPTLKELKQTAIPDKLDIKRVAERDFDRYQVSLQYLHLLQGMKK